jgi:hypothetical protein
VKVDGANDMPKGALLNFKMEPYSFGVDEDGDPIETWIVSNDVEELQPQPPEPDKLTAAQKVAFEALCNIVSQIAPASLRLPPGTQVATVEAWKVEVLRRGGATGKNPHRDFNNLRLALQVRHLIGVDGAYVWPVFRKGK